MATLEQPRSRTVPLVTLALGVLALVGGLATDLRTMALGGAGFAAASLVAAREARGRAVFTWPNAICLLVLVVWLLPIKRYRLPVNLPFDLEPYRVLIFALGIAFVVTLVLGRRRLSAGGLGLPVAAIALSVLVTQYVNLKVLDPLGGEIDSLKGFLYIATYLLVFLFVCTAIRDVSDAGLIVKVIVLGAIPVALGAILESRTHYNPFDHLDDWIPGLRGEGAAGGQTRGGALRVRSSGQHPIALGAALMMCVPLAVWLASRASSGKRQIAWVGVGAIIAVGAVMPVARTAIVMGGIMIAVGLLLRGRKLLRYWPLAVVGIVALHAVSPGVLGAVYKSFFPETGLVSEATGREGQTGSGRLSDIGPGLDIWETSPVVGIGRGNPLVGGQDPDTPVDRVSIIFDNQYMNTLVLTGVLGIAAVIWFMLASSLRLLNGAFVRAGPAGDLLVAAGSSVLAFTVAMVFFDAFSFVQSTLVFLVIAAAGLRVYQLTEAPAPQPALAPAHSSSSAHLSS
jgi:hypothetical protein